MMLPTVGNPKLPTVMPVVVEFPASDTCCNVGIVDPEFNDSEINLPM